MNAPVSRSQPITEHTPTPWRFFSENLRGGRYWCVGAKSGGCIVDGIHEDENGEADAAFIVEACNSHASQKARAEQAERSVDVLESNAREQAKLLADTGRRVEELKAALMSIRSNANCFDDKMAVATMPLIFDIATRAIRAALPQSSGVARTAKEPS